MYVKLTCQRKRQGSKIVPLPFEKVVTRTVIANTESEDDSSSSFMDLYREDNGKRNWC